MKFVSFFPYGEITTAYESGYYSNYTIFKFPTIDHVNLCEQFWRPKL
jgi:hypothetical protein